MTNTEARKNSGTAKAITITNRQMTNRMDCEAWWAVVCREKGCGSLALSLEDDPAQDGNYGAGGFVNDRKASGIFHETRTGDQAGDTDRETTQGVKQIGLV
jgi:hypothetical protein